MTETLNSYFLPLCAVRLPYVGRRRYMHGFDAGDPVMAVGFADYLEPVRTLLAAARVTFGKCWMTVDESLVRAGTSHRKPGPHVDGRFTLKNETPGWSQQGSWNHSCNLVPTTRTPVIIAASVAGCRVWTGRFQGQPSETGDLSHIADQLATAQTSLLPASFGFLLSGDCVHESIVYEEDTYRSFLRIALPQLEAA